MLPSYIRITLYLFLKHIEDHMKAGQLFLLINAIILSLIGTGCSRNRDFDPTQNHMHKGFRNAGGKHGDSRQVRSKNEFAPGEIPNGVYYSRSEEYVPLQDDENQNGFSVADNVSMPPRETPGDPGSSIPGIQAFQDPTTNPRLAAVFKNINFAYNCNLVKGDDNLQTIQNITNYMRSNPNTYIFIEGHCDERGPAAYNLALGSRRCNGVRNLLIQNGVNPDHLFTISYGTERPLILESHEDAWGQNRRAEFKVYER